MDNLHAMNTLRIGLLGLSLVFLALVFGFFYAWICSTMWGLDVADPRVAIGAMNAMNISVRNAVFAPVFFGTPFLLLITAFVSWQQGYVQPAILIGMAGLVCLLGYLVLTASINVPLNEGLKQVIIPQNIEEARLIWQSYSNSWQFWNSVRFGFTGFAFVLTLLGAWASVVRVQH